MKKVKASMMNAIHDLPLLVARDEGFFRDEGLDVEIIKTPGSGQKDSDHQALRSNIFDRTMEALYEQGACDQFRMCEWGIMKRAVEVLEKDPRPYVHYLVRETGGLLKPEEFQHWRLLHGAPSPYTRERWDDTYRWTVKWNMTVPGATYENTVDNRAWQ